jgi:hypothetical protein
MLEKILGVGAVRSCPYLVAKSSYVGGGVDGLACPLHRLTVYSHQTRVQGFLLGIVSSRHVAMDSGALLGGTPPLVLGT